MSAHRKNKNILQRVLLPVLIILVGVGVLAYPVIATQWNNGVQRSVANDYNELLESGEKLSPEQQSAAVEAAREYNRSREGVSVADPWVSTGHEDGPEYQSYLQQLSGLPAMAQVVIPSIDVNLPLYHGTSSATLERGLGHLFGTDLPVGGEGTHAVVTGHTGLTDATLLDNLVDVKVGDAVYVNVFGEKLKYEVHDTQVVLPDQTDSLRPQEGQDLLTLITCTPYGVNTHRLLVHAHRVPLDPSEESIFEDAGWGIQWWMWALGAIVLLVLAGLVWWILRERKKGRGAEVGSGKPHR